MPTYFTNQATLTYDGRTLNSNVATGELLEVLSTTKTALDANYRPGDTVTFVINSVNSSNDALTGMTITDDLGGYEFNGSTVFPLQYVPDSARLFIGGELQTTPNITAGPPLTATGITIPPNTNAQLIYQATVTAFAPPTPGGTVTNTATVNGAGISVPATAAETILVGDGANLDIRKSVSPTTVAENGRLTYTFTLLNYGNEEAGATSNPVITDTFNPILNDLAVDFNGTPWTAGTNYTYDTATGQFTSGAGQITVPPATYSQDPATGAYVTVPGTATLTVTGTI